MWFVLSYNSKRCSKGFNLMRLSFFGSKINAELPDAWFASPDTIRFAIDPLLGAQLIDFKSSNGKILAFWLTHENGEPIGNWKEIKDEEWINYNWSNEPTFIDPWKVARTLGYTNKTLNLTELGEKRVSFKELLSSAD